MFRKKVLLTCMALMCIALMIGCVHQEPKMNLNAYFEPKSVTSGEDTKLYLVIENPKTSDRDINGLVCILALEDPYELVDLETYKLELGTFIPGRSETIPIKCHTTETPYHDFKVDLNVTLKGNYDYNPPGIIEEITNFLGLNDDDGIIEQKVVAKITIL